MKSTKSAPSKFTLRQISISLSDFAMSRKRLLSSQKSSRASTADLAAMTREQLIAGFGRDSKLYQLGGVAEANAAMERSVAIGKEIVRRGGSRSLAELMRNEDPFIAYSAADAVADLPEYRYTALAVSIRTSSGPRR